MDALGIASSGPTGVAGGGVGPLALHFAAAGPTPC